MGTMGFGKSRVKGRTRVPCPAAKIIPFAMRSFEKVYATVLSKVWVAPGEPLLRTDAASGTGTNERYVPDPDGSQLGLHITIARGHQKYSSQMLVGIPVKGATA
jgi:hypothetical protein